MKYLILILFIVGCDHKDAAQRCVVEDAEIIEARPISYGGLLANGSVQTISYIRVRIHKNGFTLITNIKGEIIDRTWENY